ncbi:MAG TPA: HYR domain-containing protein [Thermoanaerobaculia bacterium]|nr:HYR domain-containing protein [Thermoanaerobaculia bacterium]
MHSKFALLVAIAVCLFPLSASADIVRVSPTTVQFGEAEQFITIYGNDLFVSDTSVTLVVFDGPGGNIVIEGSGAIDGHENHPLDQVFSFVPFEVAFVAGEYALSVITSVDGQTQQTHGPVSFFVLDQPQDSPPLITFPEFLFEEATSADGAIVNFDVTAQNPNGDPVPVACSPASGRQFPMGPSTVECLATNSFGTSMAQILIFVADTTAPVVTVPEDFEATDSIVRFETSAVDNIDGPLPVTCTPESGTTFLDGTTEVVCYATDLSFNVGGNTFRVKRPGGAPVLTVPADITVDSPLGGVVVVDFELFATNGATITCDYFGNEFYPGSTLVTCTARNLTGFDTKSFRVTVRDLSAPPPVLNVPGDIIKEATSANGAVVTFEATATNDGVVVCTPASGSLFALGETVVNCTATNASGSDSGSFKVTVRDTRPPVLSLPGDFTAEATSAAGAEVDFVTSATDVVDGNVAVQCSPASGSTFGLGTTLVSCSATDAAGNSSNGSFNVTVVDSIPPQIISVSANPGVLWPPDHKMVKVTVTVVAVDAVDPNPVSRIISVSSNQPTQGTGDGDTPIDWKITGPLTVDLRAERSKGVDRVYTITIETTDASGNTSTATDTVVVSQGRRRAVR